MPVDADFQTCMADAHPGESAGCVRPASFVAEIRCAHGHHRLVACCTEHKLIIEDLPVESIGFCELCGQRRGLVSPMSLLQVEPWTDDHPGFVQLLQDRASGPVAEPRANAPKG